MSTDHNDVANGDAVATIHNEEGAISDASGYNAIRSFHAVREAKNAERKTAWRTKPVRTFFNKVALPSILVGSLSYVFSKYSGDASIVTSAIVGLATYPVWHAAGSLGSVVGRAIGHYENFRRSQLFQQVFTDISVGSFARGAALVTLLHAGHNFPIYGQIMMDTGRGIGKAATTIYDVLSEGIKAKIKKDGEQHSNLTPPNHGSPSPRALG